MKILKNVEIYSPEYIGCKDILIGNGSILKIDKDINLGIDVEVINCSNKKAIPGYIDQHVHITGGGGEGGFKTRVPELQLSSCIKSGVTTLVGVLGTDGTTRSVENLVAKAKGLKEEGLTTYCYTGSYDYPSITLTGSVRKDIVFIEEVIGVKIAISDHRSPNVTKDELIRLATEVRTAGMIGNKVGVVHMHTGTGKEMLDMVFDIIENTEIPIKHFRPTHIARMPEEAIKFSNLGGYIDITAGLDSSITAEKIEYIMENSNYENLTMSSDANGSMPKWNEKNEMIGITAATMTGLHNVIKELIERGMSIEKAISIITKNVAKALEIYPKKGVIKENSDADILLLDEDFNIDTVIAGGKIMMKEKNILVKGTFE